MSYGDAVKRLASTRRGSWLARQAAARVDPWLYRLSGGRLTLVGRQVFPQLLLTTTGRKSGKQRTVQVAFIEDAGDYVVVASNFGQAHHPAWMHNLLADPKATVQVGPEAVKVEAKPTAGEDKKRLLGRVMEVITPIASYLDRTDRDIQVFRLKRP